MYISAYEKWPIVVQSQGKHSIPVDTVEIEKLFQTKFLNQVTEDLNDDEVRKVSDLPFDLISRSIFDRGNWILNIDRTRLSNSPERNGTMRVYESEVNNSLFVVIQLPDGERRKGLLHPPRMMTNEEKLWCAIFLEKVFNPRNPFIHLTGGGLASHTQSVASDFVNKIPIDNIGKKNASPEVIIVRDCRTAYRSRKRILRLIELFCQQGGDLDNPISEVDCIRVLDRFWNEIRSSNKLQPNSVTRSMLFSTAENCGLLIETPYGKNLALGEVAEIYFEEYEEDVKRRKLEEKEQKKKALEKSIAQCKKRLESLMRDTENTTKNLQQYEEELETLN